MFGESFRYATAVSVDQPAILPVRRPRWQKPGWPARVRRALAPEFNTRQGFRRHSSKPSNLR